VANNLRFKAPYFTTIAASRGMGTRPLPPQVLLQPVQVVELFAAGHAAVGWWSLVVQPVVVHAVYAVYR
jgi:hypothetical protein